VARKGKREVFFVDDDARVCTAARRTLERSGLAVTCFTSARSCIEELADRQCDLLIADVRMPDMDGIELLRQAKRIKPWVPVLIVTGYGDVATAVQAFKAGAAGFIEKPLRKDAFLAAVMDAFDPMTGGNRLLGKQLTPTEMRVLHLILAAYSNKEISHLLHRSVRTVEVHRRHIMDKLGVDNVVDLVIRCVQMGLAVPGKAGDAAGRQADERDEQDL